MSATPAGTFADPKDHLIADLQRQLAERTAERDEALAQQAATAEVLQVINASPGNLAPVFDSMLERATRLCGARFGHLSIYDGEVFRFVAVHGDEQFALTLRGEPLLPSDGVTWLRILDGEDVVHIPDAREDDLYRSGHRRMREFVDNGGGRSLLSVALRKPDALLGVLTVYRQEAQPFTVKQIALLQNFAAQAVIAMENARLLTETREALEQQTATAEVLQVINASPGDLAPVFDAILEKAHSLCGADTGSLQIHEGEISRAVATRGLPEQQIERLRQGVRPLIHHPMSRPPDGADFVQIPDISEVDDPLFRIAFRVGGVRTYLSVPLRKDDWLLGRIVAGRRQDRPFTDKQIALLQNFAAQAVIAMENARLLTETREALEQQTATAEVLQVINSSPGDLAPVFDAMLEKATRLSEAAFGILWVFEEEFVRAGALHKVPDAYADLVRAPFRPSPESGPARVMRGEGTIGIPDVMALPGYAAGDFLVRSIVDLGGARSIVIVPLRKDGVTLGAITTYRTEVRPFSDKQIALLESFAAQAVIAMENARLLGELRERTRDLEESLEYQTATSDVLKVISRSTFDLQPVLDAVTETSVRLCAADSGHLAIRQGEGYRAVATCGVRAAHEPGLRGRVFLPGRDTVIGRSLLERRIVHVADLAADPEYGAPSAINVGGSRTVIAVPLVREGEPIGVMALSRRRVEPFAERQIELIRTFADQAVIAIENTRLITETREALEQQTATAEVLQVINSSPGDLAPVFDAMLEKALRLCNAIQGVLWRIDGERVTIAAHHNMAADFIQLLHQVERGEVDLPPPLRRIMQGERIVYVPDVVQHELYRIGDPLAKMAVESGRVRTLIWVALVKDNIPVGAFAIARREVRSFSEKEIALLQNFAAQAVIAMENARLLTETREALEQQTAIGEVLRVISGSAFDLQPVLQSVVSTAIRLCRADQAVIYRNSDGEYRWAAGKSLAPEYEQIEREIRIRPGIGTLVGRAALWAETVQIIDCQSDPDYEAKDDARVGGIHTLLGVPLLRDGVPIGVIGLARRRVEAYNDREIELVRTFADQAVIAIENARLLTETREALEQQTATAEVLQVINSSPGDLAPVFDAVLQKAHQLCEASFGALMTFDGEKFYPVATQGVPARFRQFIRDGGIRPSSGNPFARMVEGEAFSHIHDLSEVAAAFPDDPLPRAAADLGGIRSLLIVPLRKDEALLGVITAYRQEVRPFTAKQIALLQNFAAQAVIAMENARLLGELRQRTRDLEESLEYQTATSDVLKVISRSTFDLEPVLNSVSAAAARLCGGDMSGIAIRKGDVYQYIGAFSIDPEWERIARRLEFVPGRDTLAGRVILTGQPVHIPNLATDPEYTLSAAVSIGKIRTALGVPLLREGQPIGVIFVGRYRIELFTERQIELVRTFADQAAIAIENTRLLTELRDALAQQTATAEILEVINRSPGDLTPVFDAMLEKATRLCEAKYGQLATYSAEGFQGVAAVGLPMESADALSRLGHPPPETVLGRVERTRQTVQMADIAQEPSYAKVFRINPWLRRVHTSLVVPLLKEGELVGTIHAFREEVRPFSDKQIGLLENFAAQAVIAMDNARLLNEIRQRQAELRVTFDNMGDGVAMFDGDMRLAAWNRNFQQILELPDEFVAQHPTFPEYFRYMAARGEYRSTEFEAEIGRYVEDPGHEARFERTRPDGRVIEVRRNAVPGGGFVLIVGDVTERKRAEAEIRAARDAAETALRNLQAAQASLVQAQKMAALGQLTAGIAHEIKNPLNFVNNFAGLSIELLDELKETAAPGIAALDDDARSDIDETIAMLTGNLDKIAEHGRRADNIVKSMLEHSRGVSGERRAVDLNALVDEALNLAYHGARAQDQSFNITLERDLQPGLAPIAVAPQEMMRVFLNLFSNGFYAAARRARDGGDGSFRPTLAVATRDEGEAVAVTVRDNGAGIPPEIRDRLFQPFFTTKPSGEGTGLGLSISYDIVAQQHGGTIAIDSEPGAYTEFTIRLPRRAATGVAA